MTIKEYAEDISKNFDDVIKHIERLALDTSDLTRVYCNEEII